MRIIEIPGAIADNLGAVNLEAIATLRRAIILPCGASRFNHDRAFRPSDNVPHALTVCILAAAAPGRSDAEREQLQRAIQDDETGDWREADGEAVATLIAAAEALLGAFGGDTPDYVRAEAIALGEAIDAVQGGRP